MALPEPLLGPPCFSDFDHAFGDRLRDAALMTRRHDKLNQSSLIDINALWQPDRPPSPQLVSANG